MKPTEDAGETVGVRTWVDCSVVRALFKKFVKLTQESVGPSFYRIYECTG
jgi:hypothetical protein